MGIKERKEREKGARRDEILNAAEKVFFEKGLSGATMDDVAAAAELSKGTLYLYYKRKEDLYMAIVMRGTDILSQLFDKALSTGEPTLRLIANMGEAYYEFFARYRNYFRMFYFLDNPDLHALVSPEILALCVENDRRVWDLVIGVIRRGIEEGVLHKEIDPMEAAVMLWSNSNGLMRLIDRQQEYWKGAMGVDLEATLRKSNAFLVEAMMTEEAKRQYPGVLLFHASDEAERGGGKVQ